MRCFPFHPFPSGSTFLFIIILLLYTIIVIVIRLIHIYYILYIYICLIYIFICLLLLFVFLDLLFMLYSIIVVPSGTLVARWVANPSGMATQRPFDTLYIYIHMYLLTGDRPFCLMRWPNAFSVVFTGDRGCSLSR